MLVFVARLKGRNPPLEMSSSAWLQVKDPYSNHPQSLTNMVSGRFCTRAVIFFMYWMDGFPCVSNVMCWIFAP